MQDTIEATKTTASERIEQLERLVVQMRHNVCGALSPALLMADVLMAQPDPKVRVAAERIVSAIERTTAAVRSSRAAVPQRAPPAG
jgi:hypothetical protein